MVTGGLYSSGTRPGKSQESIEDIVAGLIQDGNNITWTYDDPANTLTGNITDQSQTLFTAGSVVFADSTGLAQDNANFFWDDTANALGIGTNSVNSSAILQLDSTSKGALFPRMTEVQRDAIGTPAAGLVVYNTDTSAYNFYNGSSWSTFGVSDHGALSGLSDDDHTQYLLLAGRSGGQQANGGTAASDNLTFNSTSDPTKGEVRLGSSTGVVYNETNNNLGIGTSANSLASLHSKDVGGLFFEGTTGGNPINGGNTYLMFDPAKAAFRAGVVSGSRQFFWDDVNVGLYSAAFGNNNGAAGQASFCAGSNCSASGTTAVAMGDTATASGLKSIVLGNSSTATGFQAVAIGAGNLANSTNVVSIGAGVSLQSAPNNTGVGQNIALSGTASSSNQLLGQDITLVQCLNSLAVGKDVTYSGVGAIEKNVCLGTFIESTTSNTITIGRGIDASNKLQAEADRLILGLDSTSPTVRIAGLLTSTTGNQFEIQGQAHTGLTASTESIDVNFDLDRTIQFATGALTNQRAFVVSPPTYSFVGASTITNAATAYIEGPPVAGTNATITNNYSLWVDAGTTRLDGALETQAGRIVNTTRITSGPYTALATDHNIYVDTDSAAITVNLPAGVAGTEYRIINCGSSGNNVTIAPNGAELLLGANSSVGLTDGNVLIVVYESTEGWW